MRHHLGMIELGYVPRLLHLTASIQYSDCQELVLMQKVQQGLLVDVFWEREARMGSERLSCEGGVSTFDHCTWLDDNSVDHGRSVVGSELCLNDEFDGGISILSGAA